MVLSRSFRFGLSVIKLVRHQYILAEEQQASSAQEKSGSALNLDLAPNPGVDPPFCAVIDRATLAQHTPHLLLPVAYLLTRGVRIVALPHCGKISPLSDPRRRAR
jgi:hypothetical protein